MYNGESGNVIHRGLIAQDAMKIDPAYVTRSADGTMGVRLSSVIADLIGAIKDQQQTIEKQRATINKLELKSSRILAPLGASQAS